MQNASKIAVRLNMYASLPSAMSAIAQTRPTTGEKRQDRAKPAKRPNKDTEPCVVVPLLTLAS
jgi:hypothetical protein